MKGNRLTRQKQHRILLLTAAVLCLCLAGCRGGSAKPAGAGIQQSSVEAASGNPEDTSGNPEDTSGNPEVTSGTESLRSMEEAAEAGTSGGTEAGASALHASEPYIVENPGDGYCAGSMPDDIPQPAFELRLLSEKANGITDETQWLAGNNLTGPAFPYADEAYEYQAYTKTGDTGYDAILLDLYDIRLDRLVIRLDFTQYQYADDFAEEDRDFAGQRLLWAKAEDGILYAGIAHNTYAETSPHTAYMVAIDLNARTVLWKSAPLLCNSKSFEIIGDSIVCGYGFTAEADSLNILDKRTGRLQEQIPLKSQAYYIIRKGSVLYVRTYNMDYQFEIIGENAVGTEIDGQEQSQGRPSIEYGGDYEAEARLAGTTIIYRAVIKDAAAGSRLYGLLKSRDNGITWEEISPDPFGSLSGMGIDITFLNENVGFAALAHNGGDSAELLVTLDGGKSFQPSELEEYLVTLDNGYRYAPYDYPRMPYEENGVLYVLCGQGADGDYNGGDENMLARYLSVDSGHTFSFDGLTAGAPVG